MILISCGLRMPNGRVYWGGEFEYKSSHDIRRDSYIMWFSHDIRRDSYIMWISHDIRRDSYIMWFSHDIRRDSYIMWTQNARWEGIYHAKITWYKNHTLYRPYSKKASLREGLPRIGLLRISLLRIGLLRIGLPSFAFWKRPPFFENLISDIWIFFLHKDNVKKDQVQT